MHILIVKTSSLGDVIHTLPALTDAANAIPGLKVDWVVEEAFAEIPAWHPAVSRVIPVAVRRWRKNWWRNLSGGEMKQFRQLLRHTEYDLIIDAQGLVKSAIISRLAKGPTAGLDKHSIKEPVSSLFYNRRYQVAKSEHAVQRVRQLFSKALDYSFDPSQISYGINPPRPDTATGTDAQQTLMFLHGTTWDSKHWPERYWRELAWLATEAGYQVKIPWGNVAEEDRAQVIAQGLPAVTVMPRMSLTALATQLSACAGVVAVDTGLGHLSAALDRPTVSIYGATNPFLSGTFGNHQLQLKSDLACSPCMRKNCHYKGQPLTDTLSDGQVFTVEPACYRAAPPAAVLAHLQRVIRQAQEQQTQGQQEQDAQQLPGEVP